MNWLPRRELLRIVASMAGSTGANTVSSVTLGRSNDGPIMSADGTDNSGDSESYNPIPSGEEVVIGTDKRITVGGPWDVDGIAVVEGTVIVERE